MSQNASEIREKIEQLSTDIALVRRFVQGTDTETVPLGTPPVATPSLRKLAKDIDTRESGKADAIIAGATDRITAEGAAQETRVLAAGNAQTARVNEAGEMQHSRVTAEGNAQFSRVNTEGNTQYARVNEAGEAQTVRVNSAGQTQHAAVTDKGNALLADIGTLGTARKDDITATGAAFLLQINANGDVQNSRLTTTGAAEDTKLKATGDAQRLIVILEGDTQVGRLSANGDTLNATLLALVREAAQSAAHAAESANNAIDMTHVGPAGKGKFGFVRVGSGIDVTDEGEISVTFPAVVSTPAVAFSPVVGIGYAYDISMSAESAVYGANIATFIVAMDENYVREIPAVNNAATHKLPISGVPGSTGRIVVTAVDDLGNMSLDSVSTFQRNAVVMAAPRVLSPVDAATDVSLTPRITVQAMQVSGVPFTPEATQLQISALDDFSACVLDTGEDASYETQHQLATDLQKNTVYYVRVRHHAALYGWSAWSAVSLFETMDCFVDVSTIYSPLHDIADVALRPTISVSAFTNVGPVDTPTASQIQVATDANFTTIVAQHDGGYVTTFAPATDLALITPYYTRARHKGARWDWSAWSQTTRFTTLNAYTLPAAVIYPANGAVAVPLLATLRVADFAHVGPVDTAAATHVQVARDANFATMVAEYNGNYTTVWTLTSMLTKLTGYFVRARHKGTRWGWGEWGAVAAFTAEDAFVRPPAVASPANGSTGVALRPTISFSAFANAGPVDTVINTHFQVARDAGFTSSIHDSGEVGGYATAWTPGGNLALNSPHYVRVRHKGRLWGWSAWSAVVGFTTLNAYVNTPAVTAPANNATGVALRPSIALSAFSNVGPADVGNGTQIQIALDVGFANVVASYASAYTMSWTPGNNLGIDTVYFVRARHSGATWGWGAWSEVVQFQTLNIYVNPPSVVNPANGATGGSLTPLLQMSVPSVVNQAVVDRAFHFDTKADFSTYAHVSVPSGLTAATPYALAPNTLYFVKPWVQGSITGWKEGPVTTFRTLNVTLTISPITQPANGATGVALRPVFRWAAPVALNQAYTEDNIQIATDAGFTMDVQYITATADRTGQPAANLSVNTVYYARPYAKGAVTAHAFGPVISFRTLASSLSSPVISSPSNGATDIPVNIGISIDTPVYVGQTLSHVQFQASASSNFSSLAWNSGEIGYTRNATTSTLVKNTTYYVRVRVKGSVTGWSGWSAVVAVTTAAAVVGDSWVFTNNSTWICPTAGTYQFEAYGGYGGGYHTFQGYCDIGNGVGSWWPQASGGQPGFVKGSKVVSKGTAITVIVGGNGAYSDVPYRGVNGNTCTVSTAPSGGTSSFSNGLSATGGTGGQAAMGEWMIDDSPWCRCSAKSYNGSPGTGHGGTQAGASATANKCLITRIA